MGYGVKPLRFHIPQWALFLCFVSACTDEDAMLSFFFSYSKFKAQSAILKSLRWYGRISIAIFVYLFFFYGENTFFLRGLRKIQVCGRKKYSSSNIFRS